MSAYEQTALQPSTLPRGDKRERGSNSIKQSPSSSVSYGGTSSVSPPTSPMMSPLLSSQGTKRPVRSQDSPASPREDEFAIASDSDVWSLDSYPAPNNFNISSDSYFSHHRDSQSDPKDRGRKVDPSASLYNTHSANSSSSAVHAYNPSPAGVHTPTSSSSKKKDRRISDVSVRSIDTMLYPDYNSDSDTPLSRPRRRRSSSIENNSQSTNHISINYNTGTSTGISGTGMNRRRLSSRSRARAEVNNEPPAAKIFRNLLILEESLRQQYEEQQQLRHKYSSFLMIMSLLLLANIYLLISATSSTNSYYHFAYQIISVISFITLALFYLSGEYHRTIVRPRKFLTGTNKGLRQLNIRIVKIRVKTMDQISDYARYSMMVLVTFIKYTLNSMVLKLPIPLLPQKLINKIRASLLAMEIRAQPRIGPTEVKLVLNSRVFSTATREQWELYRNEFWAKEGSRRRAQLLKQHNNATGRTG